MHFGLEKARWAKRGGISCFLISLKYDKMRVMIIVIEVLAMLTFFNIPIYSCKEKEFEQQYASKISDKINNAKREAYERYLSKNEGPKKLWLYNQIIGYLRVYYHDNDIYFELYLPKEKRIQKMSNKKKWLDEPPAHIRHINISENNDDISNDITRTLKAIEKDFLKSYYLDLSEYNLFKKYINYLEVIKSDTLE